MPAETCSDCNAPRAPGRGARCVDCYNANRRNKKKKPTGGERWIEELLREDLTLEIWYRDGLYHCLASLDRKTETPLMKGESRDLWPAVMAAVNRVKEDDHDES